MTTPTIRQTSILTDFGPPYFDHVLAEYDLVCSDANIPLRVQEVIERHKNRDQLTWGDLYLLEKYVLCKQPEEVLRARLPGLRLNYRQIVGADAYEQYLQSRQAAALDGSVQQLRADAGRLLDALHWAYAMAPEREKMRTAILGNIAKEMVISVGLGVVAILFAAFVLKMTLATTVILVLLMGALGGFLSVQQRLEKIPTEQDPVLTMFQLHNGRFAVRLAPLTGAICALVLFLIFQAELLKGTAFPDMGKLNLAPEYGKLLLWSFIAGFAERFVPDTLDNLVPKRAETTAKGTTGVIKAEEVAAESGKRLPGPVPAGTTQIQEIAQKNAPATDIIQNGGAKQEPKDTTQQSDETKQPKPDLVRRTA